MSKLFAVYLGGHHENATLEIHDVVFAVGTDIQSTFSQLKEAWFGTQDSIHIDSWAELSHVDGYKVTLSRSQPEREPNTGAKLFFVNVGSYTSDRFGENHHFLFLACESLQEAKRKAKALISEKRENLIHTDNVIELDSITEIKKVHGFHIQLEKDDRPSDLKITNLYWPFVKQPNRPT